RVTIETERFLCEALGRAASRSRIDIVHLEVSDGGDRSGVAYRHFVVLKRIALELFGRGLALVDESHVGMLIKPVARNDAIDLRVEVHRVHRFTSPTGIRA